MPNSNYIKGRRKEYKIVNTAKLDGKIAFRSAGSHSPVDVVIIDTLNRLIEFVQAKPDTMSDKAKAKIEEDNKLLNGKYSVRFRVE